MGKTKNKRWETLKLLISQSCIGLSTTENADIQTEIKQLLRTSYTNKQLERLLIILHSTRILDTFLKTFLDHYGIRDSGEFSMGPYLKLMTNHSNRNIRKMPESSRVKYQSMIVDKRNKYLHRANKYPLIDQEVNLLLSSICECVVEIINTENS